MFAGFDRGGVVTVFPERTLALLAVIVVLGGASGDQLHALRNYVLARVLHHEMNRVGGHHVVEHAEPEALFGLKEPAQLTPSILCELEEEGFLVAKVSKAPNVTGHEVAVGAGHRLSP